MENFSTSMYSFVRNNFFFNRIPITYPIPGASNPYPSAVVSMPTAIPLIYKGLKRRGRGRLESGLLLIIMRANCSNHSIRERVDPILRGNYRMRI